MDTAGIRRKGKTTDSAELLSVVAARKSIDRARIAVIVFDAVEGITAQDAHIAGYAEEAGRGLLLVANKWDIIEKDVEKTKKLRQDVIDRFVFARKAPLLFGMLLATLIIACNYTQSQSLMLVFMCCAFFGKGFAALGWAVVSDTSPKQLVGVTGGVRHFGRVDR